MVEFGGAGGFGEVAVDVEADDAGFMLLEFAEGFGEGLVGEGPALEFLDVLFGDGDDEEAGVGAAIGLPADELVEEAEFEALEEAEAFEQDDEAASEAGAGEAGEVGFEGAEFGFEGTEFGFEGF